MVLGILKKALLRVPVLRFLVTLPSPPRGRKTQGAVKWQPKRKAGTLTHIKVGTDMSKVAMLHRAEPRSVLQTIIDKKVPGIMSYLSKGKWHVAKVLLTNLGASRLNAQLLPRKKPHPINIRINQPVGIAVKYEYGKFIFETSVMDFEPSVGPDEKVSDAPQNGNSTTSGGTIVLLVPDRIEIVQRRSYFRVEVPNSLKVNVMLWHRGYASAEHRVPPEHYWQGKLVDISAGGAQIVLDVDQQPDFKKSQFVGLRFTPMPYETPLMFDAQIRNILPTASNKGICLGLQIVGLEASSEGRHILQRLCNVVERYYQINQSSAKQRDFQTTSAQLNPTI